MPFYTQFFTLLFLFKVDFLVLLITNIHEIINSNMIAVKVDQLFFSNMGFVVLLNGGKDQRALPIFIGAAEAQAIALHINKVKAPRPLTHDLLKNVLDYLECRLKRVEICDLREGTFFARLILERDGIEMQMDSRPSDAIALALRFTAPIYVAEKVMDEAGRVFTEDETGGAGDVLGEEKRKQKKKEWTPLERLKKALDNAVKDERYEDAAKLRDEIKGLEQTHTDN